MLDGLGFLQGARAPAACGLLSAGLSGTGKTLATEVPALGVGVNLLLVDSSRAASK